MAELARAPRLQRFRDLQATGWTNVFFTSNSHGHLIEPKSYLSRDMLDWLLEKMCDAEIIRGGHYARGEKWGYVKLGPISTGYNSTTPEYHHFFFADPRDAMMFKLRWI